MENPRIEIQDVVRSITEPQDAATVLTNIDKYFTEDAYILHPLVNQPEFARGRENLKALYFIFRKGTFENKIHFHSVMFSEDLTQCTLDLTEDVRPGLHPSIVGPLRSVRFLVRVDLRLETDGKYRICCQHDNFISDITMSGISLFPGSMYISDAIKAAGAVCAILFGRFFGHDLMIQSKKSVNLKDISNPDNERKI